MEVGPSGGGFEEEPNWQDLVTNWGLEGALVKETQTPFGAKAPGAVVCPALCL